MSINQKTDTNNFGDYINSIIKDIIEFIGKLFSQKETSLDEFVEKFSNQTNKMIADEISKGNVYGGGRFYVKCQDNTHFKCNFELYFKTPQDEYLKMEGTKEDISFDCLVEADRNELKQKQSIVYEIDAPDNEKSKILNSTKETAINTAEKNQKEKSVSSDKDAKLNQNSDEKSNKNNDSKEKISSSTEPNESEIKKDVDLQIDDAIKTENSTKETISATSDEIDLQNLLDNIGKNKK